MRTGNPQTCIDNSWQALAFSDGTARTLNNNAVAQLLLTFLLIFIFLALPFVFGNCVNGIAGNLLLFRLKAAFSSFRTGNGNRKSTDGILDMSSRSTKFFNEKEPLIHHHPKQHSHEPKSEGVSAINNNNSSSSNIVVGEEEANNNDSSI